MKTKCDDIVCVYSSCEHLNYALKLCKSFKSINYKTIIFLTKDCKKKNNSKQFEIVYLDTKEGYTKLSLKTYKMLRYIHRKYDYKTIYKIDATVESGETCQQKKETKSQIFKRFFNSIWRRRNDYVGACTRRTDQARLQRWANKKQIKINSKFFKEVVPSNKLTYYSGKFYVIGYDFANFIIKKSNAKQLALRLEKHLGGTEDLMIGILYQNYINNTLKSKQQ